MLREIVLVLVYVEVLFPYLAPSYHYTKKNKLPTGFDGNLRKLITPNVCDQPLEFKTYLSMGTNTAFENEITSWKVGSKFFVVVLNFDGIDCVIPMQHWQVMGNSLQWFF